MKRKFYMRGLGLGIILTSILFMIGIALGNPMSDSAVRRRARQLGMVDGNTASGDANSRTLKEIEEEKKASSDKKSKTKTTVTTDKKTGVKTKTTTTTKPHSSGDTPSDGKKEDKEEKAADKKEKTEGQKKTSDKSVKVTVSRGDSSLDVGKKLESAGIVDSATDFNHFLEKNGYDRTIHSGTYSFKKGTSYQNIASVFSK